jgi:hypothetical protein
MITRKELIDFTTFCLNKYDLNIKKSIIDDFLQDYETLNVNYDRHKTDSDCALNDSGCAHIAFDSVKCNKCMN